MQNLSKRHSKSRKLWGVLVLIYLCPLQGFFFSISILSSSSSIFTEGNFCNAHELFTRDISIEYV